MLKTRCRITFAVVKRVEGLRQSSIPRWPRHATTVAKKRYSVALVTTVAKKRYTIALRTTTAKKRYRIVHITTIAKKR